MIQQTAPQSAAIDTAALKAAVEQIRGSLTGELVGRPEAIDHLLDLRSIVSGNETLLGKIDTVLCEVPGQRTVASAWLGVVLTDLERLASLTQTEQNWSTTLVEPERRTPPPPRHRAGSL